MHVCVSVGKHLKVWSRDRDGARYRFGFECRGRAETVGHKSRPLHEKCGFGDILEMWVGSAAWQRVKSELGAKVWVCRTKPTEWRKWVNRRGRRNPARPAPSLQSVHNHHHHTHKRTQGIVWFPLFLFPIPPSLLSNCFYCAILFPTDMAVCRELYWLSVFAVVVDKCHLVPRPAPGLPVMRLSHKCQLPQRLSVNYHTMSFNFCKQGVNY